MPYINPKKRVLFDNLIEELVQLLRQESNYEGNLNYCISSIVDGLLINNVSYSEINRIIGALECAKLEVYRRLIGPYEDIKIEQNGDVFHDSFK